MGNDRLIQIAKLCDNALFNHDYLPAVNRHGHIVIYSCSNDLAVVL